MNGEAVPAKLAVVGVESEGLLDAVHRLQAYVAAAVFAVFAIAVEVDGVHVAKKRFAQLGLALARLGDQAWIHHEGVAAEDGIHPEAAQGCVALLEAAAGAGDAVAAETHLKNGAVLAPWQHPEAPGGILWVELDSDGTGNCGRSWLGLLVGGAAEQPRSQGEQSECGERAHHGSCSYLSPQSACKASAQSRRAQAPARRWGPRSRSSRGGRRSCPRC